MGPVSGWKENTVKNARAHAVDELEEKTGSREMQGKGSPSLDQGHRGLRTRRAQGSFPFKRDTWVCLGWDVTTRQASAPTAATTTRDSSAKNISAASDAVEAIGPGE